MCSTEEKDPQREKELKTRKEVAKQLLLQNKEQDHLKKRKLGGSIDTTPFGSKKNACQHIEVANTVRREL